MKRKSRLRLFLVLALTCLLPNVSCAPISHSQEWTPGDLRQLDPLDDTILPSTDILAIYTRLQVSDLAIRVDLLDLPLAPDYHLQICLDTHPGGNPWDVVIDIPAVGHPTVTPANPDFIPRIIRDPWLDIVTVSFNCRAVPRPFSIKVISFIPGESLPADETIPVRSDSLPPTMRAPLLLAFWNAFPATTPAQALRHWDGAHTGPRGERHGLKHILDNAGKYRVPVVLLDIKTPANLAALDYMGVMPQVQLLTGRCLLVLPDVAFADPADISLDFSRRAAAGFGLTGSQLVYSAASDFQTGYLGEFLTLEDNSHLGRSGGTRLIPLPSANADQAGQEGPSLDLRRTLVKAAFSSDQFDLVVAGGDLPHSTWGNEDRAGPTFAWIAAHPWIKPLTGEDIISFPSGSQKEYLPQEFFTLTSDIAQLRVAPWNSVTDAAWESYFSLTSPTQDKNIQVLRPHYLGQVGELLAAARWVDHPVDQARCDQDLDGDGFFECVLSSQKLFAVLNPVGARMTDLFYLDGSGAHQLVGPTSQFTIGLSDPSTWNLNLGQAADPSVIPGAFSDDTQILATYTPIISDDGIAFSSPDQSRLKVYRLQEDGMEITYHGFGPVTTRLPLAMNPQEFYFNPTRYTGHLSAGSWTWGMANGLQVEISSQASLAAENFTDSYPFLTLPEDPDLAYPGGHYLPFPLSVVSFQGAGDFWVHIRIK